MQSAHWCEIVSQHSSYEHNHQQGGHWSGLIAFASALAYDLVQLLQIAGALRLPLDEILIYGTALCIVIPFIYPCRDLRSTKTSGIACRYFLYKSG